MEPYNNICLLINKKEYTKIVRYFTKKEWDKIKLMKYENTNIEMK